MVLSGDDNQKVEILQQLNTEELSEFWGMSEQEILQ